MKSWFGALFTILALLWAGCGGERSDGQAEASAPITVQPDWYAQPEQGGFFMASADGGYESAGLDVQILDTAPNLPFLQKVAKGDATVGYTRLDALLEAIEKGLPLVVIGKYAEHSPAGIMVPAESSISRFEELDQKTVMAAIYAPYVDFVQSHFGIKMRLIPHNWGVAQFVAGELDAQQGYVTSEPYHLERMGKPVRTLLVAESGYDPPHVLYTNLENWERRKPELLAFFRASMDGWDRYLKSDPGPAHSLIAERNPKMDPEFLEWSRSVLRDKGLIWGRSEEIRASWGKLGREEVVLVIEQLKSIGALTTLTSEDLSWVDFDFVWSESGTD